jgi:hypothetical protein
MYSHGNYNLLNLEKYAILQHFMDYLVCFHLGILT